MFNQAVCHVLRQSVQRGAGQEEVLEFELSEPFCVCICICADLIFEVSGPFVFVFWLRIKLIEYWVCLNKPCVDPICPEKGWPGGGFRI